MERDTVYPANVDEKETEQEEERSANVTNEEIDISEFHESYQLDLALSQLVRPATPLIWHPNEPHHINELNEYCMQRIFEFFPLQSLIQLRGVSRKWYWDIHRLLRSKRSIQLVGPNSNENSCHCQDLPNYPDRIGEFKLYFLTQPKYLSRGDGDFSDLSANRSAINALPRLFPNITRLVVCIYQDKFLYNMYTVFPMWSKLEVLTLFFYNASQKCLDKLWSIIKMLNGLKELHLLGDEFAFDVPPHINTLRQLEAFTYMRESRYPIYFFRAGQILQHLLSQLSPQLRRLCLYGAYVPLENFESFCRSNSSTVRNLTHLTIGQVAGFNLHSSINYPKLCRMIATHMPSLINLNLLSTNINLQNLLSSPCSFEVLNDLSELKLLEELTFTYFRAYSMPDIKDCRQLPSLKRLWLNVVGLFNTDQFFELISFIFPSLEIFHILSENHLVLEGIQKLAKNEVDLQRYFPQMQPRNFGCGDRRLFRFGLSELFFKDIFQDKDII